MGTIPDGTSHKVSQAPIKHKVHQNHPNRAGRGDTHRHLSKVSSKHTGNIVRCVILLLPIQVFAILNEGEVSILERPGKRGGEAVELMTES